MTMAKGRREFDPMPCETATGRTSKVTTSLVILIWAEAENAPSTAASSVSYLRARSWLMYSSMMTRFGRTLQTWRGIRRPRRRLKFACAEQGEQASDARHGDVGENKQGTFHGFEHGVENDVYEKDGEGATP